MAAGDTIGMMEGAFFVSRGELLGWINDLLGINMTKVEQMASGAAYCQMMDAVFPGSINLSRVNFMAKHDYEFVNNYKLLQNCFAKHSINKYVEVEKLCKAKYQDNLEFMQWAKRFFDMNSNGRDYNGPERRKNAPTPWDGTAPLSSKPRQPRPAPAQRKPLAKKTVPKEDAPQQVAAPKQQLNTKENQENKAKLQELGSKVEELTLNNELLEREKEFYFGKLRDIEVFCGLHESEPFIAEIQKILFASDEQQVQILTDGSVSITSEAANDE